MRYFIRIILVSVVVCLAASAWSAPPQPKGFLHPTGGMRGQTVSASALGEFKSWPVDISVEGAGLQITCDKNPGSFRVEIAADAALGIRWLRLFNAEGASKPIPFMVGALNEMSEAEPNGSPAQAEKISNLPIVVNGNLRESADVDVFEVTLEAGQTLIADVDACRHLGSRMDGVLQVASPQGFVLQQNHDTWGLDPRVVYTASQAGTVLVRVFAFPAEPNQEIELGKGSDFVYRLTMTTGPFVDYGFPLAVEHGKESAIGLFGWNLSEEQLKRKVVIPSEQQEQWLFFSEFPGCTVIQGTSSPMLVESEPNTLEQPQATPVPSTISGRIGVPGDADVYVLDLRKNQPVLIRIQSRLLGFSLFPVVNIFSDDDKSVLKKEDLDQERDFQATYDPPKDGGYRLSVSNLLQQGDARHLYRMSITSQADYDLSVAVSELKIFPGDSLEVPVQVTRQLNFSDAIEVFVEGLPEGTLCVPVQSKIKDGSAREVKLKIIAGEMPSNGPITIRGKSLGETPLLQTASIKALTAKTRPQNLWLTIAPAK